MIPFRIYFKLFLPVVALVSTVLCDAIGWTQESDTERLVREMGPSQGSVFLEPQKLGSGFVIKDDGLIGTNFHVARGMCKGTFQVGPQDEAYPLSSIFNFRPQADIVIIRVQGVDLSPVKLGTSKKLKVGSKLFTLGSPEGLAGTPGEGRVTGFRMTDQLMNLAEFNAKFKQIGELIAKGIRLIQHDIPIAEGSSGSPIFDANFEVVGINFAGLSGNNNFAIPIEQLKELLKHPDFGFPVNLLCKLTQTALPIAFWTPPKNLDMKTGKPLRGDPDVFVFTAVDGKTFLGSDRNGDGTADEWWFATGTDGNFDFNIKDGNFDGIPDVWAYDINHDGKFPLKGYDRIRLENGKALPGSDGIPDNWLYWRDKERVVYLWDYNQNGIIDTVTFDTGEGVYDLSWTQ